MAESDPKPDCNDTDTNVVFIDTNLDTYLALLVSHNDTVSHLKKRILLEHPLCFPKIGQIQILAVKVKRKGYFYHLSDPMLVRSAFNGANKSWFLSVDASELGEHGQNQQLLPSGSLNEVACLAIANNALVGPIDNMANFPSKGGSDLNYLLRPAELENKQDEKEEVPFVSPCASQHTGKEAVKILGAGVKSSGNDDIGVSLPGSIPETEDQRYENNEVLSLHTECEVGRTNKGSTKDDCNICEDDPSISVPSLKKKRKSKRKRDNNFQEPQSENKQDEEEGSHFDSPSASKQNGKEVVQKLEKGVKSSGNNDTTKDDCNVCEEDPSISVPSVKKKRKSKKKKEDTMRDDSSKENISSVDNPLCVPSKIVSSLNKAPQLENKQDENEESHFASPYVSEHNLEKGVKSSDNDDTGILLPGSIPETEDRCYINNELPSLHIECEVDWSSKGITKDDCNVCEEDPSISVPSVKKKWKSKKKKEDTMRDDTPKENISSVDMPLSFPSKIVSSFNKAPQLENKQDENEESHFASPCVSEHNLEKGVKSSGNDDTGISLPGSIPETEDRCYINNELPSLHIECEVDRLSKGITKDDCNLCEEDPSISAPSVKKKRKSKKKKEDTIRDDTSKENISSVDMPLGFPSKIVSSFNKTPQSENKQDENEESHLAIPCVSEHNLEKGVKSSGNNDTGISLPGSIPATEDHCYINNELSSLHIECEVDRSSKGITKDDHNVFEEDPSISMLSLKKKGKSKRKKGDIVQDDTSKENVASVGNPLSVPSKKVSNLTNFAPQLENKQDEKEDTYVDDESMKEASKAGPAGNKKHAKRKRSLTRDSEEMLKVETASQKDEAHKDSKESKDRFEFNNDKSRSDVQDKHDKVPEDVSETRVPAKKKQKGKVKHGDKSLSKEKLSMISDFNVEKASHHFLEDQQKIKNSSDEQSAEHFKDADSVRISVMDSRMRGKEISSNRHETPVVSSSRKDYEVDPSSIQEDVQQEISDGLFSKGDTNQEMGENRKVPDLLGDSSMNEATIDNMEIGTDACKEGVGSKVHPSDVNEPKELTEDNVNLVIDHRHTSEAGQSEGTEEGRGVSAQNDPKPMLVEECPPSNQDNTGANIRDLNVTSKVVDENGMTEPVKSEKQKRVIKGKDSGGGPLIRDGIGPVDASDNESLTVKSLKATNCDPPSGNAEIEENQKNIHQEEVKGTVRSVTEKQDDFSVDNAGSLEQIRTEANAKHLDENVNKRVKRQRKISNSKETSTSKSVSNRAVSSLGEKKKPHANASGKRMDLEKKRERFAIPNSKLEGSKKKVQNKAGKASGHNVGVVVSNTQQKKSLLAGAIFKDDSSGTSEDEGEVDNSDASTRTPSDNSLLSVFSDGDSKASLDSPQNGLHGAKRLENSGRSALKESLSGTKGMAIDHVLRSSRRYKKAKITASQTESQLEFVPDSLADT